MTPSASSPPLRISAVVTAYNCAPFLAEALESVLGQTRPVDEIVVVDDGSTDDPASVAARYADRGVRYVRQPNQGASAARNRGLHETTGELVAFLDGDDIWLPEKIERQAAYLAAHPEAAFVTGGRIWWSMRRNVRILRPVRLPPEPVRKREILINNYVGNPSMALIRRSALAVAGEYDLALRDGQDWELWIRLVQTAPLGALAEPIMIYRWHEASLTNQVGTPRLDTLHAISRRAILRYAPRWQQPWLLARAYSKAEWTRADYFLKHGFPRGQVRLHALRAWLVYPFEDSREKLKILFRVLAGEQVYRRIRQTLAGKAREAARG